MNDNDDRAKHKKPASVAVAPEPEYPVKAMPDDEIRVMIKGVIVAYQWHTNFQKDPSKLAGEILKILHEEQDWGKKNADYHTQPFLRRVTMRVVAELDLDKYECRPYVKVDYARLERDVNAFWLIYQSCCY